MIYLQKSCEKCPDTKYDMTVRLQDNILQTFDVIKYERLIDHYLVLTHAVTRVKNDPLAHHDVFVWRVVVKTVAGLAPVLQLQRYKKQPSQHRQYSVQKFRHRWGNLRKSNFKKPSPTQVGESHHSKHAWLILRDMNVGVNIIQVPLEVFTAQFLSKLLSFRHVTKRLLKTKTTKH